MCIPRPRRHTTQSTSPITKLPYQRLDSPPPTPRMVPKPTAVGTVAAMPTSPARTPALARNPPASSSSRVSLQHERLLLELLPFKDATKFHDWLDSNFVRGPWNEFNADFLSRAIADVAAAGPTDGLRPGPSAVPEPEKIRTAQAAREALNGRKAKFCVYRPDKSAWTAEDHHVRFIVTLVADNMLQNLWYESEWKKKGLAIAKAAYEVLIFLKATMVYADPNPPSYSA